VLDLDRLRDRGSTLRTILNGIAASSDGTTIYATIIGPGEGQGGVLALAAF